MGITDSQSDIPEVDVTDHDGSTKGLHLAGTLVTALAAELNLNDQAVQAMTTDGAISVKNGVVTLATGTIGATLADPTATTDDYKRLSIVSLIAAQHTVTSASSFGSGGSGEDVATFSGIVGDTLSLMAYQGHWYVTGAHQVTIA